MSIFLLRCGWERKEIPARFLPDSCGVRHGPWAVALLTGEDTLKQATSMSHRQQSGSLVNGHNATLQFPNHGVYPGYVLHVVLREGTFSHSGYNFRKSSEAPRPTTLSENLPHLLSIVNASFLQDRYRTIKYYIEFLNCVLRHLLFSILGIVYCVICYFLYLGIV